MERREVRRERLEVECAGDERRVEQPLEVGDRERGEAGRERVAVQQREPFAGLEPAVRTEQPVREVGHRGEIGLAERAEHPHPRLPALVQRVDHALRECRAGRPAPRANPFARTSSVARTTSSGAGSPCPTRWFRISRG